MSLTVEYLGEPITPRDAGFTLNGSYVDVFDSVSAQPVEMPERLLTIRLQQGECWSNVNRRIYRRGQPVRLWVNDAVFVGRVKYRRMEKLVCIGRFVER